MKLSSALLLHVVTICLPLKYALGQKVEDDPYRNFMGHWSGAIVVNPESKTLPGKVSVDISEAPDGSKMLWAYTFGMPGGKNYQQPVKWITLNPAAETMTSDWDGFPSRSFKTSGLVIFTHTGYGKFSATFNTYKVSFFTRRRVQERVTYELTPTHLTYLWEEILNGTAKVYSQFSFDRVVQTPTSNARNTKRIR